MGGSWDICYSSVGQLVQHVSEEHQDSFPNELLHAVPLWPSTPSIGLDTCPLCPSTGPTDAPILIDHVLEHTHDFALLSLPWADLPIEDSQGSTSLCYLELLQRSESEAPSLSRHMSTWFENLGKPLSAQSNAAEAALSNLTESRKKRDCQQDRGHFATNDYFASEAEDSPMTSSSSFGTPSSVEENTSLENTQIELRELNTGGELSEHMPKSESSSSRPKADQEPETNRSPALSETDNEGIANDGGDHDISRSVVASTTVDPSTCPAGEGSSFTHETRSHVHESSPSPDRGRSSSHVAAANAETIDPRYRVEHSSEFQPGKIIKVLLYHTQETDALSENLHHYFRRFIVIANHGEYSTCVPIRSYGGEACTRQGVEPENHGVVYRNTARVLAQERPLGFPPVKVKMTVEDESLGDECRINYSNLVDIGHDLKVLFIGRVTTRSFRIVKYAV
ncbi:hypothetical protein AK830_g4417 [Neonectria ditissima]|uniref:DUF6590 domain-containing protein n=1 Tax=Neonectria ditissima TaxID=78410 RepID=A0A0P7BNG9_9HYPO|nr:hypothetical protein AK830_g4417 [Neonectria ditissima]